MSEVPQPRRPLTVEEFLASLDQSNPAIERVRRTFNACSGNIMQIYKKDASLYEMVKGRLSTFRLPIIDKPLQVVVEARDDHEKLTGALFCYHAAAAGDDPDVYDDRIWGEMYHRNGYGYYYSGAYGDTRTVIITAHAYKPDRYDKDLFIDLKLN